jgi:4-amino-4-deoxy-L-arabinose transferase-like glycosyltransferase
MRGRALFPVLLLAALCAVVRLPGLRALPIFCDEAILLHWAELIREEPFANAFVSLQGPGPPLYHWLLALSLPVSSDPVIAGRLLGVALAVLTVPLLFLLSRELVEALADTARFSSERCAAVSGLLFVLCPYLTLHQRLSRVEPLFLLEAAAVAWLGLRIGGPAASMKTAVALGLWLGAAMLTRQNVSYLLWAIPILGYVLRARSRRARPGRTATLLSVAASLSLLVWAPMLLPHKGTDLFDRIFFSRLFVEPMALRARLDMGSENVSEITGWFWTYLTPPLFVFALGALVWLWITGQRRLVGFLTGWFLLTVGPLVFFGRFLFSRYGVTGVLPLLLAAGAALSWRSGEMRDSLKRSKGRLSRLALASVLFAWPLYAIFLQAAKWIDQPFVRSDRRQFVSGWAAGFATERAVDFLENVSRRQPIVLFIPRNDGNPMDTLWVSFWRNPSVLTFSLGDVFTEPLLRPGPSAGSLIVDTDPRRREPSRVVPLPANLPIYTVSPDPIYTLKGPVAARELLRQRNPDLQESARFWNPPPRDSATPSDGIVVYRLR